MFADRYDAGVSLGRLLKQQDIQNAVVVGIPRGGVITAIAVAQTFHAAYDVLVVKKIPSPVDPELAIGAVGGGKHVYWDERVIKQLQISESEKQNMLERVYPTVVAREKQLRTVKKELPLSGKTVIVVDDGVATGATVICAAEILREKGAREVILATPVVASDSYRVVRPHFDSVFALQMPTSFHSVSQYYQQFAQVSDEEVLQALKNV